MSREDLELNDYQRLRLEKADRLRQAGRDPYPPRFTERTHTIAQVLQDFEELKKDEHADPPLEGQTVGVAGRIYNKRDKKVVFADLVEDGVKIQIYLKDSHLEGGAEALEFFKDTVDLGDIVGVVGKPFVTRTGEKTIEVHDWFMLTKSINVPPDKHEGLKDVEQRYRQRYADLLSNAEIRDVFAKRSAIVRSMRNFLDRKGFIEVETPVLQPLYGGASARPFTTLYNALDQTFYLRIADELYLKRLLVGGFSKVYEISKDFRNEGIDYRHSPEFTMMECYQAFADYNDIMDLVEEMIPYIAQEVLGTTKIHTRGYDVELGGRWPRLKLRDAIKERTGLDYEQFPEEEDLYREAHRIGVSVEPGTVWPKIVDEIMKQTVVPTLIQPTFLYDYPQKLSPLAKRKPGDPNTAERFQPFIAGIECGNAFSELNDPLDQRERFLDQRRNAEAGDDEAMQFDEDFINALMYGMPPTGGLGIGIDRLVMLLLDQPNIRDVILFPAMRNLPPQD
ncbi:MAG TPA: lysine--tRNA ligase [Chloroflexia bacterium]|nr:lysine--tRNA ligase [Chloroflexia bacterium]